MQMQGVRGVLTFNAIKGDRVVYLTYDSGMPSGDGIRHAPPLFADQKIDFTVGLDTLDSNTVKARPVNDGKRNWLVELMEPLRCDLPMGSCVRNYFRELVPMTRWDLFKRWVNRGWGK